MNTPTKFLFTANQLVRRNLQYEFSKIIQRGFANPSGTPGSGAGRGGGPGGSVREAGGGMGKYGAAQEEGYFFNKQKEQLKKIKRELKSDKQNMSQKEEK